MRPNATRRPANPVVRRTRRSALVCVVFVIAVAIMGAVSAGPRRADHALHLDFGFHINPSHAGYFTPNQTVTVVICSTNGIASTSATLNGQPVTFQNSGHPGNQCGFGIQSESGYVAMTLPLGNSTLSVSACDNSNNCDSGEGFYSYSVPTYWMTLTANQPADTFPATSPGSVSYTVRDTGTAPGIVSWRASCAGGVLRCGTAGPDTGSFTASPGVPVVTTIALHDTVQGTGQVTFTAWFRDSSTKRDSVTTPVTAWAPAPTVTALHSPLAVTPGVTVTDTFTVTVGPDGAGPYALTKTCDPVLSCTLSPTGDTISANGSQRAVLTFRAPYTIANQSRWVSVAAVGTTAGSQSGSGSGLINVGQGTIASVSVTLDQPTLTLLVRDSTQAHATVTYADNSTVQNAPATWSFTTGGVAAVNSSGFVTAEGLGTTSIQATVAGVSGSAPLVVSSATGIAATMQGINPQGSIAREQCLTIAAGDDAAYECGDLRVVHPLPGVSTMNRARAPTLIYNSRHSKPTALIAVDVLVTNDTVTQLQTALTIGGHTLRPSYTWTSACANVVCRLVIPVPADSLVLHTGWYADSLQVTAGSYSASVLGGVAIVNRTTSPFGAGWWLDGLEQLAYTTDTTAILWVTGDGSTRLYRATGAPDSVFTAQDIVDRPDTLIKSRGDTTWRRHVGNNAIVQFNNGGQHIRTINRQGDTTRFVYDAITTALDSIILPSPSATRLAYTFQYDTNAHGSGSPVLKQVQSPGASGPRTTTLTPTGAWQVTQITDPDTTTVGFTWDTTSNRIVSRRNRKNDTTTYTYDAAGALNRVSVAMRAPDSALVTTFCAAETRTLAICAGDGTGLRALPLDSVVTRMDGPRTDSVDVTRLFISRFGAPDTVIDAHGGNTHVMRDATFPALADAVINPIGFEQDAVYNSRGLLQSSKAKNPFGNGQDATTRYGYDPKWNLVDTITAPTGEASYFSYDATTGNRLWQRAGQDPADTVRFFYNARNQLDSILAPAHTYPQRVAYDATLGNVSSTTTPMGYHTDITRNAIGAETMITTPTDAPQTPSLRKIERLGYDIMGRVLADTSIGAVMSYHLQSPILRQDTALVTADTLFTSHAYDAEGRRISTLAVESSSPNYPVDCCMPRVFETWSYDAAGRVRFHDGNSSDSTFYDPASNVTRVWTASGGGFTQQFDALNRLTRHSVAARTYPLQRCEGFRPGFVTGGTQYPCLAIFPAYPNNSTMGYTIPADVASFTYDQAGHMLTADDSDATVHRQYFPGGALKLDSATYRNALRTAFEHPNGIALQYDLSGRRTQLTLPGLGGTIAYGYSVDNGLLTTVTDPTSTQHRYVYDPAQRVDSIVVAANGVNGVWEGRSYDDDDRAYRRTRTSALLSGLNQDSLIFDAQGRITRDLHATRANGAAPDTTDIWYTGLGAVLARERRDAQSGWETEEFRVDAMGNVLRDRSLSSGSQQSWTTALGSVFERGSAGRLVTRGSDSNAVNPNQLDTLVQAFDIDGHTTLTQHQGRGPQTGSVTTETEGLNYYGSDGKLRAAQRYIWVTGNYQNGTFEEYRYDALGRRVLVVTQRGSTYPACDSLSEGICEPLCSGMNDCDAPRVLWTTWDGQQILKERRDWYPDGGGQAELALDTVSYVHGLELDHPLAVLDESVSGGLRIPNQQWRGLYESSVTRTGAAADFSLGTPTCQQPCPHVAWPAGQAIYSRPGPVDNNQNYAYTWGGTLLGDGQDATAQLFRRNRYYDADVGRFTQEDPIGLAGGMNLYGFAAGDPVNSSDPFGLCIWDLCIGEAIAIDVAAAALATTVAAAYIDITNKYGQPNTWFGNSTHESRRFSGAVKDETETRVREANGGVERCSTCGVELTPEAGHDNSREFDHLTSVKNGGGNGPENCDEKCRAHNRKKGSLNEDEWQKKTKENPEIKKQPTPPTL